YAKDLFVTKYTPAVLFQFRDKANLRSNKRQFLSFRYVNIKRDDDPNAIINSETVQPNYNVFNIRYKNINKDLIDFSSWFADFQIAKHFGKASFNYEYRKLTERNRQYNLRFF